MSKKIHKIFSFIPKKLFFLVFLFIVSFGLRFAYLNDNLFFGPEQGIDFLVIKNLVVNHKLILIGSKTDINGIFHGPVYYYFSALPFLISNGDPLAVASFFIVINCLSVFLLYSIGKKLFNQRTGLIASLLFTFSFEPIVYARWLSNPPLSITLSCLYILFLLRFLKGNKKSLLFSALFFGLLAQSEFLNLLFFSVITFLVIILFFKDFKKQNIYYLLLCFIIAIIFSVGHYILFDVRHEFLITKNILLLLKGGTGYHITFLSALYSTPNALFKLITNILSPNTPIIAVILYIISIILLIKDLFKGSKSKYIIILLLWLFVPPLLLIILHHDVLDQFFVSLIPAIIIAAAYFIDKVWKSTYSAPIFITIILICLNLIAWISNIPRNANIFFQTTQPQLHYSDQLKTIDKIYKESGKEAFDIQTYTIPYWSQQGWEYLFWSHGFQKFNRLPSKENPKNLFVIIQDDPNNIRFQKDWLDHTVSKWGKVLGKFKYGDLTTQKLQLQ